MGETKPKTKKCVHCQSEIPLEAKICPNCNKKQGGIMPLIVIAIIIFVVFKACAGGSDSNGAKKSGDYTILGDTIHYSNKVNNDVTGNWRISTTNAEQFNTEFAVEYYNTMFGSDEEIHAIINYNLNKTIAISLILSRTLRVAIHEYVEYEEYSAKDLFGGRLISEYFIDLDTGKVEKMQ